MKPMAILVENLKDNSSSWSNLHPETQGEVADVWDFVWTLMYSGNLEQEFYQIVDNLNGVIARWESIADSEEYNRFFTVYHKLIDTFSDKNRNRRDAVWNFYDRFRKTFLEEKILEIIEAEWKNIENAHNVICPLGLKEYFEEYEALNPNNSVTDLLKISQTWAKQDMLRFYLVPYLKEKILTSIQWRTLDELEGDGYTYIQLLEQIDEYDALSQETRVADLYQNNMLNQEEEAILNDLLVRYWKSKWKVLESVKI